MSRTETERTEIPDPEVVPTAQRRRFTSEEKLRILEEADACTESGEMGALLRREGIYSSYLSRWRRAQLTALSPKKRGPKPPANKALVEEVPKLRRENERLRARLAQAEVIIEVQKKLSQLLGLNPETNGNKEGE
jgi:transposase-like protein